MSKSILKSLTLMLLAACADPFDPGSLIVEPRVLGVQVQVDGAPARATPHPGEMVHLTLLTASLEVQPVFRWALAVCVAGLAPDKPCQGEPLLVAQDTSSAPSLTFTVPSESQLGDANALSLFGIVCSRGEPASDASGGHCAGDDAHGTPLEYHLALSRGSDDNLQPDLAQTEFRIDGASWPENAPLQPGCAAQPDLPRVRADGKEHDIALELGPNARETYLTPDQHSVREELELSHFVTAGKLSRQFSFVERSDTALRPEVAVSWKAPHDKDLTGNEETVRLIVVVRDQRGGIAQLERSLCVVR